MGPLHEADSLGGQVVMQEGLLLIDCNRTKSKSGKRRMEDRKDSTIFLLSLSLVW